MSYGKICNKICNKILQRENNAIRTKTYYAIIANLSHKIKLS